MTMPNGYGIYNSLINNDQFINSVNVADFLLNLLNMELNISADDLEKQTEKILEGFTRHVDSLNEHLLEQDRHLREQDRRIDRIESLISWRGYNGRMED